MFNPGDDNTIAMYPLISHTEVLLNVSSWPSLVPWCGPRCIVPLPPVTWSPSVPCLPRLAQPAASSQPGDKLMFSGVKWAVAVVVTPGWHGFITQEARLVTARCQGGEYAAGQSSVGTDEGRSKGNKDLKVCFFSSSFVPFIILQNESSHPFNDSGQSSDLWHRHRHQAPAPYLQHISTSLINSFIPHSDFFIFLSAKNIRNARQRPAPSRENGKMRYFRPRTSSFPSASLWPCRRGKSRSFGFKSNPNYEGELLTSHIDCW